MNRKFHDQFDYENAKRDIHDAGGDPDYLSYHDPAKRDDFMKKMGMDPKKYGSNWDDSGHSKKNHTSGSGSSGCFLTSACVKAAGLPDDCEELTTLRWFRDHYIRGLPEGEHEIQEYYRIAPGIVSAVNEKEDACYIWKVIYDDLIRKCVKRIKNGDYQIAYTLYREAVLNLQRAYLHD